MKRPIIYLKKIFYFISLVNSSIRTNVGEKHKKINNGYSTFSFTHFLSEKENVLRKIFFRASQRKRAAKGETLQKGRTKKEPFPRETGG